MQTLYDARETAQRQLDAEGKKKGKVCTLGNLTLSSALGMPMELSFPEAEVHAHTSRTLKTPGTCESMTIYTYVLAHNSRLLLRR